MFADIDFGAMTAPHHPDHARTLNDIRRAAQETGFMTLFATPIGAARVRSVIDQYRRFFRQPAEVKAAVDMARTGANRGWGAPLSEQVDPTANPDYKEVFDCGLTLAPADPVAALGLPVYAPNLWPEDLPGFRDTIRTYYADACAVALGVLRAVAQAIGQDAGYFDDKFDRPMALLRGNYYPERPAWAGAKDHGIAPHTDYGCLTLLATDGSPGLEVQGRDGAWHGISAAPGRFVINFGEMLEIWTRGQVVATPHRVIGTASERISVPLFFNPNHDTNVAPIGSGETVLAGAHMARRFGETYVHLQGKTGG